MEFKVGQQVYLDHKAEFNLSLHGKPRYEHLCFLNKKLGKLIVVHVDSYEIKIKDDTMTYSYDKRRFKSSAWTVSYK